MFVAHNKSNQTLKLYFELVDKTTFYLYISLHLLVHCNCNYYRTFFPQNKNENGIKSFIAGTCTITKHVNPSSLSFLLFSEHKSIAHSPILPSAATPWKSTRLTNADNQSDLQAHRRSGLPTLLRVIISVCTLSISLLLASLCIFSIMLPNRVVA